MGLRENILKILPRGLRELIENRTQKRLESREEAMYRAECLSQGRAKDYEDYLSNKKHAVDEIARMEEYLKLGLNPQRWSYEIQTLQENVPFIRPNSQEDINYREGWADAFPTMIKQVTKEGDDLRFHGTSIAKTQKIIESGGIFSSVDINNGYRASFDLSGEISASTIDTVAVSLNGWFTDIAAHRRGLPCGSLFVLKPRTDKDIALKERDAMESVNFREHPEQLYGIISTPENMIRIQEWLAKAGYDPALAYTFDGFIHKLDLEKNNQSFDDRYHYDPEPITQSLGSEPTEDLSKYNTNINHEKDEEIK